MSRREARAGPGAGSSRGALLRALAYAALGLGIAGGAEWLVRTPTAPDAPMPVEAAPAAVEAVAPGSAGGEQAASPADRQIASAEARLRRDPERPKLYAELAGGFMNKARETGDGSYYGRAEAAARKALELGPDDYDALRVLAWVYTGQHRFREARQAAEQALARAPDDPWNYGTLGDALIELGEYEAAADAIQKMVNLRPGVPSYTRAAYMRELYGDPDGAIEIMRRAVSASARDPEQHAWCLTQLGHLLFNRGQLAEAEEQYGAALEGFAHYQPAWTGLGRVRAAQERYEEAIEAYRRSLAIAPTHDAAVELGDLFLLLERGAEAQQQFALLDVIEKINRANRVEPDALMALFYADHDRNLDEALAIAQRCAAQQPTIRSLDALAWALHKNGRDAEALASIEKALQLGTQDAALHYHAGMIQAGLGHAEQARAALRRALEINPHFRPLQAREARTALERLGAQEPIGS